LPILIHTSSQTILQNCTGIKINTKQCPSNPVGWWELNLNDNVSAFLLSYFLYFFAAVHQSFALSTLFNDSKVAGEVGTFITFVSTLLSYLIFNTTCSSSDIFFASVSLLPQPAVAFAYIIAADQQNYLRYIIYPPHEDFAWSIKAANAELFFDSILYLLLYIYLDQVNFLLLMLI
jgi:ATP-binding cassette subfamily A (ABC1) protein 3